jgi:DNA-3-methyladenine glycosylase II
VPIEVLDEVLLRKAVGVLADHDPDLAAIVRRYGAPPMWSRPPGYSTLIRIILEQQVSLSSARAAYERLEDALGEITPSNFLRLNDAELKAVGFSRQKTRYGRMLAEEIVDGSFDIDALGNLPDEEVRARLIELKGIGRWSADIYLLMALRRPNIWPHGDLALVSAVTRIKGLDKPQTNEDWDMIGEAWRPWRSVAARLAWFDYLDGNP